MLSDRYRLFEFEIFSYCVEAYFAINTVKYYPNILYYQASRETVLSIRDALCSHTPLLNLIFHNPHVQRTFSIVMKHVWGTPRKVIFYIHFPNKRTMPNGGNIAPSKRGEVPQNLG